MLYFEDIAYPVSPETTEYLIGDRKLGICSCCPICKLFQFTPGFAEERVENVILYAAEMELPVTPDTTAYLPSPRRAKLALCGFSLSVSIGSSRLEN